MARILGRNSCLRGDLACLRVAAPYDGRPGGGRASRTTDVGTTEALARALPTEGELHERAALDLAGVAGRRGLILRFIYYPMGVCDPTLYTRKRASAQTTGDCTH